MARLIEDTLGAARQLAGHLMSAGSDTLIDLFGQRLRLRAVRAVGRTSARDQSFRNW
jgi:hypothetical protein